MIYAYGNNDVFDKNERKRAKGCATFDLGAHHSTDKHAIASIVMGCVLFVVVSLPSMVRAFAFLFAIQFVCVCVSRPQTDEHGICI